jgi:hypothetical protein
MAQDDTRLRHVYPNPELAKILVGPAVKKEISKITSLVLTAYINLLPESEEEKRRDGTVVEGSGQRNLKRGASMRMQVMDTGGGPRWHGWVVNTALSYRPTKGQPYPRFIEYGKPARNIDGGHQLRRAAAIIAGGSSWILGAELPSKWAHNPKGKGSQIINAKGQFARDPRKPPADKKPPRRRKTS